MFAHGLGQNNEKEVSCLIGDRTFCRKTVSKTLALLYLDKIL